MVEFGGQQYFDDRLFVVEFSAVTVPDGGDSAADQRKWAVITRQNVVDYPVVRVDSFDTMEQALEYLRNAEPTTPRISLGGRSPDPPPSIDEYRAWLESIGVWERHVWE